jgi:hypothetical protein
MSYGFLIATNNNINNYPSFVTLGRENKGCPLIACTTGLTLPRKSGHSRRVDNRGECSDDPKTAQDIYRRAKS